MIGDEQLGKKFLASYLSPKSKGKLVAILDQLQAFIDHFGASAINPIVLSSISSTDPHDLLLILLRQETLS